MKKYHEENFYFLYLLINNNNNEINFLLHYWILYFELYLSYIFIFLTKKENQNIKCHLPFN